MIYRYLDVEGLKGTLRTRSLRLAKISALNNPFDFNPVIKMKEDVSGDELHRDWLKREANFSPSALKEAANKYFGIISFSKNGDDPLLWAHYAERHQGGCIGFDIDHPPFLYMKARDFLVDVVYTNERSVFYHHPHDDDGFRSQVLAAAKTKADVWRYENEVRAILPTLDCNQIEARFFEANGYFHLRINANEWQEIRFGIATEQSAIDDVMRSMRAANIQRCSVYKACLSRLQYRIEFDAMQNGTL